MNLQSVCCVSLQNLFAQQSGEQSEKIFAASQAAMNSPSEPAEKPHTLEEYSYDHFRYGDGVSIGENPIYTSVNPVNQ